MEKKRIAHVITGLGVGGAEVYLKELLEKISTDRHDIYVFYFLKHRDLQVSDLKKLGITVTCIDLPKRYDVRRLFYLIYYFKKYRLDLVHSHLPVVSFWARIASYFLNIPHVYTEHNTWDVYHPITKFANKISYCLLSKVIAVSKSVADSINISHTGIKVIHNGVDVDKILLNSKSENLAESYKFINSSPNEFIVGNIGNYSRKKNHLLLLEAFSHFTGTNNLYNVKLVLIGQFGNKIQEVYNLCDILGIREFVEIIDGERDIMKYVRCFDVLAITSFHEGLPISMLEAMALGVPVVSTKVGGVPEAVRDGIDGMLTAAEPAMISKVLSELYNDTLQLDELGRAASLRIRESFSIQKSCNETLKIYEALLGHAEGN